MTRNQQDDSGSEKQGFASMSEEERKRIARKGGEASHQRSDSDESSESSGRNSTSDEQ